MSYDGNIISAPVSIDDVKQALGESSNDLATLCKSKNINMWSKYKPISYSKDFNLTYENIKAAKFGITPYTNDILSKVIYGVTNYQSNFAALSNGFNDVISGNKNWYYNNPSGGKNAPYRLEDFIDPDNKTNNGYRHNSVPPINGFGDWEFNGSKLTECIKIEQSILSGSDSSKNNGNNKINTTGSVYSKFNCRFGSSSSDVVGNIPSTSIPLPDLLGSLTSENAFYRFGIAIQIPTYNYVDIFIGAITFYEYNQISSKNKDLLFPCLASNQRAAYNLLNYIIQHKTSIDYPYYYIKALPVILKNATMIGITRNTGYGSINYPWTYSTLNNGLAYGVPYGNTSINIKIVDDINHTSSQIEVSKRFIIKARFIGQYTQLVSGSGGKVPVNNISIYVADGITGTYTFTYDVTYEIAKVSNGTIIYESKTITNQTLNAIITDSNSHSDNQYKGYSRFISSSITGPGLTIKSYTLNYK